MGKSEVAYVASGANPLFSLETLMHARVSAMLLRDTNMPVEQGDWQSLVCGETVNINYSDRARTSAPHVWRSHMIAVGSILCYKNDSRTVDRRVVMFDVSRASPDEFDRLRRLWTANVDICVQTVVDAYLTAASQHGKSDIWAEYVLPPDMHHTRQAVCEMTNPLLCCLLSDAFIRDDDSYMPLSAFKVEYSTYRRGRGLPPQRWTRDHWQATFWSLGLKVERSWGTQRKQGYYRVGAAYEHQGDPQRRDRGARRTRIGTRSTVEAAGARRETARDHDRAHRVGSAGKANRAAA